MFYIWIFFLTLVLLLVAFLAVSAFIQRHHRRKAMEIRGYRIEGIRMWIPDRPTNRDRPLDKGNEFSEPIE